MSVEEISWETVAKHFLAELQEQEVYLIWVDVPAGMW
jgi:hypothetical protein